MATKSVQEQIAEHESAIKKLKESQLEAYETEYATVSARASELRTLIGEIKGTPVEDAKRTPGPKKEKVAGKQVSVDSLKSIIKENGGEYSIRKGGHDLTHVKKMVENFPKIFKLGPKGPWPTVLLVEK